MRIEVAAKGLGGQTVVDGLFWVQKDILTFDPDLVILLEGINDLLCHGGPDYVYTTITNSLEKDVMRRQRSVLLPKSP